MARRGERWKRRGPRPTNRELYEQAKRLLRAAHPGETFLLACHLCGDTWPDATEMGMIETHFQISHAGAAEVQLDLVWIGEGPPPPAGNVHAGVEPA